MPRCTLAGNCVAGDGNENSAGVEHDPVGGSEGRTRIEHLSGIVRRCTLVGGLCLDVTGGLFSSC